MKEQDKKLLLSSIKRKLKFNEIEMKDFLTIHLKKAKISSMSGVGVILHTTLNESGEKK